MNICACIYETNQQLPLEAKVFQSPKKIPQHELTNSMNFPTVFFHLVPPTSRVSTSNIRTVLFGTVNRFLVADEVRGTTESRHAACCKNSYVLEHLVVKSSHEL